MARRGGAVALALLVSLVSCEARPPGTATPECSTLAEEMEQASIALGDAIRESEGRPRDERKISRARARLGEARAAFEEAGCG